MKAYYEQGGITIFHADCRDVLPTLDKESVDLVLTGQAKVVDFSYLITITKRPGNLHQQAPGLTKTNLSRRLAVANRQDKKTARTSEINDLQAGKAGEYLVCADLILRGHIAFPSEQGLPFDVVAEFDSRLVRIQVKTTRGARDLPQRKKRTPAYLFHVRRMGKNGRREYKASEVDLFALVALDSRKIAYIAECDAKTTMSFRVPDLRGEYRGEDTEKTKNKIRELRREGITYTEISEALGVDRSYANRVVLGKEDSRVFGRYLSDFTLDRALDRAGLSI